MSTPDFRSGPPETTAAVQYLHFNTDQRRMLCLDTLSAMGAVNISERGEEIWHSCLLPFGNHAHGDRNPACSVNYGKMVVNCFVCGGGSFQWWVATVQGLDSAHEARSWIAKETGHTLETGELSLSKLEEFLAELLKPQQTAYKPPLPHYDERILDNWRFTHPYMTEVRHIPEPTIVAMQVGWNGAKSQVTIPHIWRGKLVGWQVRNLGNIGPDRPKYKSDSRLPQGLDVVQLALPARPVPGDRRVADVGVASLSPLPRADGHIRCLGERGPDGADDRPRHASDPVVRQRRCRVERHRAGRRVVDGAHRRARRDVSLRR